MGREDEIAKPADVISHVSDGVAVVTLSHSGGTVLSGSVRKALIGAVEAAVYRCTGHEEELGRCSCIESEVLGTLRWQT